MKKLTKANTPYARLSVRGQLLLVFVCLTIAWLGFWAYTVLADVPATSIGDKANALPGSLDPDRVTTAATATMRIDPVTSTVTVGQSFSVNVVIDDVANLGGFEFELNYNDPNIIQVTEPYTDHVTLGPFLGSTGRDVYPLGPVKVSASCIKYGAYSTGSSGGPNGSGTLATITFDAVVTGTTPLSLQNEKITDIEGVELAVTHQGGQVNVTESTGEKVYLPIIVKNY